MKKSVKKLSALLMTVIMVLAMSATAFAAESVTKPSESDAKDVIVENVEAGATVRAYQIIGAVYDSYGFNHYKWGVGGENGQEVKFGENGEVTGLTSDFITDLAKDTGNLGEPVTATVSVGATSAILNLAAGTWMIIVTPPAKDPAKVYNPMVASVYYTKSGSDNTMGGGPVSANDNWTLVTTDAYAKSTEITLTKGVDDEEAEVSNDTVNYTVTTTIPSYSNEYTNPEFTIEDNINNGLEYTETAPVVKVGGLEITAEGNYVYAKGVDDKSFTITFDSKYVQGLADKNDTERAVKITYSAKLTDDAIIAHGINRATVTYSVSPSSTSTKFDTEYVDTFEFDGILKKVKEDKTTALGGAEFTLYRAYDETKKELSDEFGTFTTLEDGNGNIKFEGLDADRTYYLKETKAPKEYTINEKVYKVTFSDINRDNDGKVVSYTVKVDDKEAAIVDYGVAVKDEFDVVVNTKLSSLPSTGGIGTTIFTIGGCVIMIAAAGLFFASRRKEEK